MSARGRQRSALGALFPGLLALVLAGCGERVSRPADDVRGTAETLLSLCRKEDARAATTLLTGGAERTFLQGASPLESCEQVLHLGLSGSRPEEARGMLRAAAVTKVTVSGDFASAQVDSGDAGSRLELAHTRGSWRVAGAASTLQLPGMP